jgi:acetoin utilization deacetylase AcuC-like enzyme
MAGVEDLHLDDDLQIVEGEASLDQLSQVHSPTYLRDLSAFCEAGGGDLDPDTYATASSFEAARSAVGAGLAAIDALQRRGDGVAFVAARPPGHHATRDRPMGFCLLNSIAVAAATLVAKQERVLVVDLDVHHGNGTQEIFWNDPSVLYVSTHQWPLFPGSGAAQEIGGPGAPGLTVNVPLPPGAAGEALRRGLDELASEAIDVFDPTWVRVSAGFDAHRDDPIADLVLSSGDYAELAKRIRAFTPQPGRVALFLEGGYDLPAVRESVAATLGELLGAPYQAEKPTSDQASAAMVDRAKAERHDAMRRAAEAPPEHPR